jgi:proline dehydrogenase
MIEENHSPNQLQIIGQLAREYEQKYKELEDAISEIPPEKAFSQLKGLAEHTTDRFRSAQVALFSTPCIFDGEGKENALTAATALCRAFDEMRILFQFLAASHKV